MKGAINIFDLAGNEKLASTINTNHFSEKRYLCQQAKSQIE